MQVPGVYLGTLTSTEGKALFLLTCCTTFTLSWAAPTGKAAQTGKQSRGEGDNPWQHRLGALCQSYFQTILH